MCEGKVSLNYGLVVSKKQVIYHCGYTVKNFGLFQPVKGCLGCAHVQRSNDNSINYHISNN